MNRGSPGHGETLVSQRHWNVGQLKCSPLSQCLTCSLQTSTEKPTQLSTLSCVGIRPKTQRKENRLHLMGENNTI